MISLSSLITSGVTIPQMSHSYGTTAPMRGARYLQTQLPWGFSQTDRYTSTLI